MAARRSWSLYEKSALGGLLDFAEMVKGKHESLSRLKNHLSHVLEVEGVNVVTGKEVDAAFAHEEKPDVVIVSTGSKRPGLAASGSSATPVIGATDFLSAEIGNNVVAVLGFNAQTVDTAHYLTAQGKKVTIVSDESEEAFGTGQSMMLDKFVEPVFLAAGGSVRSESKLKSVGDGEVVLTTSFGVDITASFYGRGWFLICEFANKNSMGIFPAWHFGQAGCLSSADARPPWGEVDKKRPGLLAAVAWWR